MAVKTYSVKSQGNITLSTNFKVKEFSCKDGSDKVLIDSDLVELLQKIRTHFNSPVTINSAYRSSTYNAKIGGASKSQHVYGTAADIVVKGIAPLEVAKYAEYCLGNKGGIGLYSSFTHVDVRTYKSRWNSTSGKEVVVSGFPGYSEKKTSQSSTEIKTDNSTNSTSTSTSKKLRIFIDAGHNYSGFDTGCSYYNLKEQNITFDISNTLKEYLEKCEFEVKLSRESKTTNLGTNANNSLLKRCEIANEWNADYFISIHCNAYSSPSANGTETYIYSNNSKSKALATLINNSISKDLGTYNRGIKTSTSLVVLKKTNMPAMLIETAFLSNKKDSELLSNKYKLFAFSICNSICTFFNKKCNVTKPIIENITESTVNNVTEQKIEPYKYTIEGTTHVIRIDPRNLWAVETQCPTNKVPYNNFVNSIYFMPQANGKMYPLGIMVNAGKVISNYATHGKPVSTLIIKDMDNIYMKKVTDITQEGDVWFAVSGYGVYPDITYVEEGFTKVIENGIAKDYSDVARVANRPIIGYSSKEKKIIIAVRAGSNAQRAAQTAKNLGMDFAISLDGGGSTTLKINNSYKFRGDGRSIFGGLTWN